MAFEKLQALHCSLYHPSCPLPSFCHQNSDSLLQAWTAFEKLQALLCFALFIIRAVLFGAFVI
jgi:hypothetical protein